MKKMGRSGVFNSSTSELDREMNEVGCMKAIRNDGDWPSEEGTQCKCVSVCVALWVTSTCSLHSGMTGLLLDMILFPRGTGKSDFHAEFPTFKILCRSKETLL